MVLAAAARYDLIHLQHAEREIAAASVARTLLLAEEDMLVLAIRHRGGIVAVGVERRIQVDPGYQR